MVSWTDSFLDGLIDREFEVSNAFDSIISIYEDFVGKNQKIATDKLWLYLDAHQLITQSENSITYTKLLFRGRPKGVFDEKNIRELFHVPFSKRHLIGNQRFSVSGQPMLYFGSSILAITKETEKEINELAIAAFLPSYSFYYKSKIFSLTNHIGDCIEKSLPGIVSEGGKISYTDERFSPSQKTIVSDIHQTVLMHICTFPTEFKGSFVAEYAIPQMLTSALLEHGYAGLIFPSTKDYSNLTGNHNFSSHHINLGLFVPYDKNNDINESLLNTFSSFAMDGLESYDLTIDSILRKASEVVGLNKKSTKNNNDYIIPIVQLKHYIEYMNASLISDINYFETDIGKLELEFYMKMLCYLEKFM